MGLKVAQIFLARMTSGKMEERKSFQPMLGASHCRFCHRLIKTLVNRGWTMNARADVSTRNLSPERGS